MVNSHEIVTGDFTRDPEFHLPADRLQLALEARLRDGVQMFDASDLAKTVMGDSIYSNMMIFGAAWQRGLIPLSHDAIAQAITLNGAAVEANLRAFEVGRWAALYPAEVEKVLTPTWSPSPKRWTRRSPIAPITCAPIRASGWSSAYHRMLDGIEDAGVKEAVAKGYHKLLAYKDEYEVARLHLETAEKARAEFGGDFRMKFHLAPPVLSKTAMTAARKSANSGPASCAASVSGKAQDAARHAARSVWPHRGAQDGTRADQAIRGRHGRGAAEMSMPAPATRSSRWPNCRSIRGFGPVKQANEQKAEKRREELLAVIRAGGAKWHRRRNRRHETVT